MYRSLPDIRRARRARNYFGDGTLGHVRITSAGARQSADGVLWSAIPGWTLAGSVVSIPSTQDGDMVIVHAASWQCDAGMTVTTSARCRGLLVYVQGDAVHNGIISMTARGPRANPADAAVTATTPVAPTDGHAVPTDGITIRRLAAGHTDVDDGDDLMWGCGASAVAAEAKQPPVQGDGIVIRIPRVGGSGGSNAGASMTVTAPGLTGATATNAPGGGGTGSGYHIGAGAAATCFGGGSGGGGSGGYGQATSGAPYCGAGGAGEDNGDCVSGGGAGNPGGLGGLNAPGDTTVDQGGEGVGGVALLIVGGSISGSGSIIAGGSIGGGTTSYAAGHYGDGGGGSGGGVAGLLYAGSAAGWTGTLSAPGGLGGAQGNPYVGGPGAAGAVIGPTKVDPA